MRQANHDEPETTDVLVMGGGVAGLAAARELSKSRRVLVLEAATRVGGRIRSHHLPESPLPIELGPEFIHGHAADTFSLLDESGLIAYDIGEKEEESIDGVLVEPADAWKQADQLLGRLSVIEPAADCSFDAFLTRHAAGEPHTATKRARSFVEGFNAAYADRISAHALRRVEEYDSAHDGERQYRLIGAYDRLPQALARSVVAPSRVVLQTRVLKVGWAAGRVEVLAERAGRPVRYRAAKAVIALPLGVLQREGDGGVAFDPELPLRSALRTQLVMGNVVKAALLCDRPLWEDKDPDASFIHAADQAFPTWWTTLPLRTHLVTGWAGGPAADRLPRGEANVARVAVESFAALLGQPFEIVRRHVRQVVISDWRDEPLTGGAYSWAAVGGSLLPDRLADPIDTTLYMAGEHTFADMIGTVAGAIASGKRAAERILHNG